MLPKQVGKKRRRTDRIEGMHVQMMLTNASRTLQYAVGTLSPFLLNHLARSGVMDKKGLTSRIRRIGKLNQRTEPDDTDNRDAFFGEG